MAAERRPRAALWLSAALVALPLWRRAPEATACPAPAERAERGGHTIAAGCSGGPPLRGPARLLFGLRLDPNTADAVALEVLPGLGAARARAVVEARCLRRFDSLDDLERVPGIGSRTRAALEPWLAIDPAAEPACPLLQAPGAGEFGDVPGGSTCELPGVPGR